VFDAYIKQYLLQKDLKDECKVLMSIFDESDPTKIEEQ
jgi:hypothetical protein